MQFSRAVFSKDLRILDTLNKGVAWEFKKKKKHYSEIFLNELVFFVQTSEEKKTFKH